MRKAESSTAAKDQSRATWLWFDLIFTMVMGEETDSKGLSDEVKTKPEFPGVRTGQISQTLTRKAF